MSPRAAVRALAFGRIAIGLALVLAPRRAAAGWIGSDADRPGASLLARALGIRDAIFGGMVLHTVDHPQVGRRWLAACAVADAVDFTAALSVRGDLPPVRGTMGMLVAGSSAAAHAALAQAVASPGGLEDVAASTPPAPASSPETVYPDGSDEAMRSMGARTSGKLPD